MADDAGTQVAIAPPGSRKTLDQRGTYRDADRPPSWRPKGSTTKATPAARATDSRGTSNRALENPLGAPRQAVEHIDFDRGSTVVGRAPKAQKTAPSTPADQKNKPAPQAAAKDSATPSAATPGPASAAPGTLKPVTPAAPAQAAAGASPKSASPAAVPGSKPLPDDDKLRMVAEKIVDIYYQTLRKPLFQDPDALALSALSWLTSVKPDLTAPRLRRLLRFMQNHADAYREFLRWTRNPKLASYLNDLDFGWDEMYALDPPSTGDWAEFAFGAAGGVAAGIVENDLQLAFLARDIPHAIYVAVGRYWDPKLEQTYEGFTSALHDLLRHPLVHANKELNDASKEIESELSKRHYRLAGHKLGHMIPNIIFNVKGIKDLGKLGVAVAKALPRVGIRVVQKFVLLKELSHFYLSSLTHEVTASGAHLERVQNVLVVTRENGIGAQLDLASLTGDELAEWQRALKAEPADTVGQAEREAARGTSSEARATNNRGTGPSEPSALAPDRAVGTSAPVDPPGERTPRPTDPGSGPPRRPPLPRPIESVNAKRYAFGESPLTHRDNFTGVESPVASSRRERSAANSAEGASNVENVDYNTQIAPRELGGHGKVGIQQPGLVNAGGPDSIVYDPVRGVIEIRDTKGRGPGGSFPLEPSRAEILSKWGDEVSRAIDGLPGEVNGGVRTGDSALDQRIRDAWAGGRGHARWEYVQSNVRLPKLPPHGPPYIDLNLE